MESREIREQSRCCNWKPSSYPQRKPIIRNDGEGGTEKLRLSNGNVQEPEHFNARHSFVPHQVLRPARRQNLLRRKKKNEDRGMSPRPLQTFMKNTRSFILKAFAALTIFLLAGQTSKAQIIVGTGDSISYLVIEATQFSSTPFVFEWHYDYNLETPRTTFDMVTAVEDASTGFTFELLYGGGFLNAVTYSGITLTNENAAPYSPFWAQWVSGGESGAPLVSMPSGIWSEGYGLLDRTLMPGSWDGFIFNGAYDPDTYAIISAPPSIAPVPEPHAVYLAVAGGLVIYLIRRSRYAKTSV